MNGQCTVWDNITIGPGTMVNYEVVAGFHYRGGGPRGVVRVWVGRFAREETKRKERGEVVGVLVEVRPVLNCALRGVALGGRYAGAEKDLLAVLLNEEVRTIARVVVVPRFRGIGLGVALVRHALARADTRYVEALAVMGRVQPFFEKAGMRRYERPMGPEAVRLLAAVEADDEGNKEKRKSGNGGGAAERLMGLRAADVSVFLAAELRRFAKRKAAGVEGWLAEARERVGAVPVYYLCDRGRVEGRTNGKRM